MPFRFLERVLLTPETLFSLAIGLLVSVMICLGHPPHEADPNATNRLFLHLIEGVLLFAAIAGSLRVWRDGRHERSDLTGFHAIPHPHHR